MYPFDVLIAPARPLHMDRVTESLTHTFIRHTPDLTTAPPHDPTSQLLSSTLRAMQLAITALRKAPASDTDMLVPVLCGYMFHGRATAPTTAVPYCRVVYTVCCAGWPSCSTLAWLFYCFVLHVVKGRLNGM